MRYLDSHCHLNDPLLFAHLEEIIQDSQKAGVSLFLIPGWDLPSSQLAVKIAHLYPNVYAAVGFQPENIDSFDDDSLRAIEELAMDPKVKAIGEIGLDYHFRNDDETKRRQKEIFIAQIELANKLSLPISIHARDASQDTYEILSTHPVKKSGVLHCYSGSSEMLVKFASLGFYFGFGGPITFKNAETPKKNVTICPLDRLLSETDSPYLTPVPFRGKTNSPSYIPYIVRQMGLLKGLKEEEIAQRIEENFIRLFSVEL